MRKQLLKFARDLFYFAEETLELFWMSILIRRTVIVLKLVKRLVVLSLREGKRILYSPVRRIAVAQYRIYLYMLYSDAFRADLEAWNPDLIQCHDWQTLWLGVKQKNKTGAFLIFDSHELEVHRNPPFSKSQKHFLINYEKTFLPKCDLVTTVGEAIADHLSAEYGIAKPSVIHNAPLSKRNDALFFEKWGRQPQNQTIRDELNLGDDIFVIVTVGNVTINRGIDTSIEALARLPQNCVLVILGKQVPNYKPKLDELIDRLGVQERVFFVEPVNPIYVVDYISGANAGIISTLPATLSYEYSLPNKLFECAFANLDIVASDTSEVVRVVKLYKLGDIFDPGSPSDLANKLLPLIEAQKSGTVESRDNQAFREKFAFEVSLMEVIALHISELLKPEYDRTSSGL